LMPQRLPISPKWATKLRTSGERAVTTGSEASAKFYRFQEMVKSAEPCTLPRPGASPTGPGGFQAGAQ
jgi:hypothetical protein